MFKICNFKSLGYKSKNVQFCFSHYRNQINSHPNGDNFYHVVFKTDLINNIASLPSPKCLKFDFARISPGNFEELLYAVVSEKDFENIWN